ncbi:hypothetical protein QJS10_CPB22g00178 [Acorus calamus]|uniref:Uncharacterized protein n=1 Tax=Acorus calamus TaxID=4465 RepID=A0AAV9BYE2_ACOCL|nr:hypothetical protein QJS10_CPB22g00178 [Acorus calamus]
MEFEYLGKRDSPPSVPDSVEVCHLLHLFYISSISPVTQPRRSKNPIMAKNKNKKKVNNVLGKAIQCGHLLPLFSRVATSSTSRTSTAPVWIPTTTELKEAGVKFKVKKNATSFLGVTFRDGLMEIPTLALYEGSESKLRNLIAFEQCYPNTRYHVTFHLLFMDFLLNSPQDILILQQKEIILNWLSSKEEATQLFKQINREVTCNLRKNYLSDVCDGVTRFCMLRRNKWRALLIYNYFTKTISFMLVMTIMIIMTFFTMYPYHHPRS